MGAPDSSRWTGRRPAGGAAAMRSDIRRGLSSSAANVFQNEQPDCGRQIEVGKFHAYVRDELIGRQLAFTGDLLEFLPESILKRNAGAPSINLDGSFDYITFHGGALYTDLSTMTIEVLERILCLKTQPGTGSSPADILQYENADRRREVALFPFGIDAGNDP
jgi:hypothetical protein